MCLRCGFGDVVMSVPALRAWRAEQRTPVLWLATRPAVDLVEVLARPEDAVGTYLQLGLRHWGDRGDDAAREKSAAWAAALDDATRFVGLMHAPEGLRDAAVAAGFGDANAQEDQPVELAAAVGGAGTAAFVSDAAAAGWGLSAPPEAVASVEPPPPHARAAEAWLGALGLPRGRRPLLAAAVNGGSDLKVWPPQRVAEVLIGRPAGTDAVLIAGPDAERAAAVQRRLPEPLPALGPAHLLTAAAVLARCTALLTNDSGLLHLAAAVGTPTVAVFGPTRAKLYMPRVERGGRFAGEALESTTPCPLREPDRLGPPACVVEGVCRIAGLRSCVDAVPVGPVAAAVGRALEPSQNRPLRHPPGSAAAKILP